MNIENHRLLADGQEFQGITDSIIYCIYGVKELRHGKFTNQIGQ